MIELIMIRQIVCSRTLFVHRPCSYGCAHGADPNLNSSACVCASVCVCVLVVSLC
jgi:hypothetical protein